jgi:endonuclease/exonuclease/phosphatase family metal-dependent hydrolase
MSCGGGGEVMDYTDIRNIKDEHERKRLIGALDDLRKGLTAEIPSKTSRNLLLASWNIREFGGKKYGGRTADAMFCIAECISRFDLVAVQEVRSDLAALKRVMRYLGSRWDVIYSDVSYADGGNNERLAFLYDTSKVSFRGLAGELVLPMKGATDLMNQVARTPFICGFQAGWAKFNLCTVHIYYGKSVAEDPRRVDEIEALAELLAGKAKDYIDIDRSVVYSPENLVLLGDFNIFGKDDATYKALTDNGFVIPDKLNDLPGTNVKKDKFYDQIAFFKDMGGVRCDKAGVFDFYKYVFNNKTTYAQVIGEDKFMDWRTYQMSDHLIMWCEFDVDHADAYLKKLSEWDGQ